MVVAWADSAAGELLNSSRRRGTSVLLVRAFGLLQHFRLVVIVALLGWEALNIVL